MNRGEDKGKSLNEENVALRRGSVRNCASLRSAYQPPIDGL